MTTPNKKILLNSSAIRQQACDRRLYLIVKEGWRNKLNNNDIEFGSAFHKFASTVEEHPNDTGFPLGILAAKKYFDETPMFIKSKKKYLTTQHLLKVCTDWYNGVRGQDEFELLRTDEGKALVEIPFQIPLLSADGYDVDIVGTIDRVGKFRNGCWAIRDYKTTSSYDAEEYLESYSMSVQLRLYIWAFLQICKTAPEGSPLRNLTIANCGCMIDGIFLNGADKFHFKSSRVFYLKQEDMDEFESELRKSALNLINLYKDEQLPARTGIMCGACETKYGKCDFFNACASPDMISFKHVLNKNMHQVEYNPLRNQGQTTV